MGGLFFTCNFKVIPVMVLSSSSEIMYWFQQLPQPISSDGFIRNIRSMANFLDRCHMKIMGWACSAHNTEHVSTLKMWTLMEWHWIENQPFNMENVLLPSPGLSVQSYPSRNMGVSSAATEQCSDISVCPLLTFLKALILHRGQQESCCSRGWAFPVRLSMTGCRENWPI